MHACHAKTLCYCIFRSKSHTIHLGCTVPTVGYVCMMMVLIAHMLEALPGHNGPQRTVPQGHVGRQLVPVEVLPHKLRNASPPICRPRVSIASVRVRGNIIVHARNKYVCKYHSCMVISGRSIPHAPVELVQAGRVVEKRTHVARSCIVAKDRQTLGRHKVRAARALCEAFA